MHPIIHVALQAPQLRVIQLIASAAAASPCSLQLAVQPAATVHPTPNLSSHPGPFTAKYSIPIIESSPVVYIRYAFQQKVGGLPNGVKEFVWHTGPGTALGRCDWRNCKEAPR